MQSDFNSMFEEFQRQVDVPDQLLNALKHMAEGRNYYWSSSYETDESLSGFYKGKKSLIRPGILIKSIESIHSLTCDFDVEFTDFISPEWTVCYLNDDYDYLGVYSLSDAWFKRNLQKSNLFYIDTTVKFQGKKYFFTLIVDSETKHENKRILSKKNILTIVDDLFDKFVENPNFESDLLLEKFVKECREYVKAITIPSK
ncbi:phage protein [Escherichia phage ime09]|uniref:Phage protein n=1 Tax=Escherichia phage ime09 TaxID=1054834 RepID=G1FH56_9CAUD|nr:phage protein [Escherichia phage ime09]AEK12389.1 phage protein [Escherichia phage ime09]